MARWSSSVRAVTRNGGYAQANAYDGAGNPITLRGVTGLGYNADNQVTTDTVDGNGNPTRYGTP